MYHLLHAPNLECLQELHLNFVSVLLKSFQLIISNMAVPSLSMIEGCLGQSSPTRVTSINFIIQNVPTQIIGVRERSFQSKNPPLRDTTHHLEVQSCREISRCCLILGECTLCGPPVHHVAILIPIRESLLFSLFDIHWAPLGTIQAFIPLRVGVL